jgi:predicted DNA-binding protein
MMRQRIPRKMTPIRIPVHILQRVRMLAERTNVTRSGVIVQILEAVVMSDTLALADIRTDVQNMELNA